MSAPEVYTALERGTFQAASFPFAYSFTAYKLHEVSKWYTLGMQLGIVHNPVVLSQTAWKALPDEYKKILEESQARGLPPRAGLRGGRQEVLPAVQEARARGHQGLARDARTS